MSVFQVSRTARRAFVTLSSAALLLGSVLAVPVSASPAPLADGGAAISQAPAGTVRASVAAGGMHTCALKLDGTVACWGNDEYGQASPPVGTFTALAAGHAHTCGITTAGTVACWGDNTNQQATAPTGTFSAIAAGRTFTCAIRTAGTVACSGLRVTAPEETFTAIDADGAAVCGVTTAGSLACWGSSESTPPTGTFTDVALGAAHGCAIGTDSTITCWGDDSSGQASPPAGPYKAVTAGASHSCAIGTDGALACWGAARAALPPGGTFLAAAAGSAHTCAVSTEGTVACWGDNSAGQADASLATFTARAVAAASYANCVIKTDGTPACWGDRLSSAPAVTLTAVSGQSGSSHACGLKTEGTLTCWGYLPPVPPSGTFVALGGDCGIKTDGTLACWGSDFFNDGLNTPPAGTFTAVATGWHHRCAIRSDGTLKCWGRNDARIVEPSGTFSALATGGDHACAIATSGRLACWGNNDSGQATPPTGTFTAIAASEGWSCGIRTTGALACWGLNAYGESLAVPPSGTFTAVAVGYEHGCAIGTNGAIACWGVDNGYGYGETTVPAALQHVPPQTTISSGPVGPTRTASVSFAFGSSVEPSTFECSLDANAFTGCTSPQAYAGLVQGDHAFRVRATDQYGNTDFTPAQSSFTVDTVKPDTNIDSYPTATTTSTSATFAFSSDEPGAIFQCRLDDAPAFTACSSPKTYTSLALGSHTFRVRAVDAAGNVDFSPDDWTWTIQPPPDTTPPTVSKPNTDFLTNVSMPATSNPVPVRVSFTAADTSGISSTQLEQKINTGSFAPVTLSSATATAKTINISASPATTRQFRARATDTRSNTSAFQTANAFRVRPYQNGNGSVVETGTWSTESNSNFYGGSVRYASAPARQSVAVTGTDFAIVSTKGPNRGKAEVWVDGVRRATIDLYSSTAKYRQLMYAISFASAGQHTIELRVLGTKNASSSGRRVDFDAFLTMAP